MPILRRSTAFAIPHPHCTSLLRRLGLALSLALLLSAAASADGQTLAHPGWDGNFNLEPWWQHAVFYKVEAPAGGGDADFKAITAKLDGLRSLSVDALLLPAPHMPGQGAAPTGQSSDAAVNDLDELIREASQRDIRVLLTLEASSLASDISGQARFWLAHGVAGLNIVTPAGTSPEESEAIAQTVRRLAAGAVGQRIVLSAFDSANGADASSEPGRHAAARHSRSGLASQLEIDSSLDQPSQPAQLTAAKLRPLLAGAPSDVLLAYRETAPPAPLADVMAALLLATRPAALIDADEALAIPPDPAAPPVAEAEAPAQPAKPALPPNPNVYAPYVPYTPKPKPAQAHAQQRPEPEPALSPLAAWYRDLAALHHGNAVLRQANTTFLDFDAQDALVWVARSPVNSLLKPSLVVACNLSSATVHLALGAPLRRIGLRGYYLRTVLRSDSGLGPQDIDNVTLPPHAVYIGEIHLR